MKNVVNNLILNKKIFYRLKIIKKKTLFNNISVNNECFTLNGSAK